MQLQSNSDHKGYTGRENNNTFPMKNKFSD